MYGPATTPASTGRNLSLDGLRGCAATAVIFFHCLGAQLSAPPLLSASTWHDMAARAAVAVFHGDTAVNVFFIMSGAVLMNSLQHRNAGALKFVGDRFFRLMPALVVSVLACYEVRIAIGEYPSPWQLFANLTLYDNAISGPTWTLNAEAIGTILILGSFLALRRFGLIPLLLLLILAVTAARHMPPKDFLYHFRWSVLPFALGVLIPTQLGRAVALGSPPALLWVAVALAIFGRHLAESNATTASHISMVSAALVVALLFYNKAGMLGRMLSTTPLVFLGTISYSIYLFNVPLLILLEPHLPATLPGGLAAGAIVTAATIPIAAATYRLIELPAIRFWKRLEPRRTA